MHVSLYCEVEKSIYSEYSFFSQYFRESDRLCLMRILHAHEVIKLTTTTRPWASIQNEFPGKLSNDHI